MSCGLTTSMSVSAFVAASTLRDDVDAVPLAQLGGPARSALGHQQLARRAAGADQTGDDGLAHHAGTEDRNRHCDLLCCV